MNISSLLPNMADAGASLDGLAGNPRVSETEKIVEASRQFEAILLRQILQSARKTVFHSELTAESSATSIYKDMVTEQLADAISRGGTFGLAASLRGQLSPSPALSPNTLSKTKTP